MRGEKKWVAVKQLFVPPWQEEAERLVTLFKREVGLLSALDHQHIVRFHGTARNKSYLYIVQEVSELYFWVFFV